MKIKVFVLSSLVALGGFRAWGQAAQTTHRSPVDFAITLAGNVGEVRASHFHSGIDIKALGGVGTPVYATAEGYVSRIGVSPTGYGNVLYVSHPATGEVSVYGHLDSFVPSIAAWVKAEQIKRESFKVDLYPAAEKFPVAKGQRIGSLGNSGSSGGPHLHYEIREGAAQSPVNIISRGIYSVADRVAPTIYSVMLFEVDTVCGVPYPYLKQEIMLTTTAQGAVVAQAGQDQVLKLSGSGFLAYKVIDYKDGCTNTMGIYALEQRINGAPNFAFKIDKLSFSNTRFVNTFTDFQTTRQSSKYDVIRAYVSPNNGLHFYDKVKDRGIISAAKIGNRATLSTTIWDDSGNSSVVNLIIEASASDSLGKLSAEKVTNLKGVYWDRKFDYQGEACSLSIDPGSLYESTMIKVSERADGFVDLSSPLVVPFYKSFMLELKDLSLFQESTYSKLLVVGLSDKGGVYSAGGAVEGGVLKARISSLGTYGVGIDTLPPQITQIKRPVGSKALQFKIVDDLSGIKTYRVTVDGKWVVAEYDPRIKMLKHIITPNKVPVSHNLQVTVIDNKNNKQVLNTKATW